MTVESNIHGVVTDAHGSAPVAAAVNASIHPVHVNEPGVVPAVHVVHVYPSHPVHVNVPGVAPAAHWVHPYAGAPTVPAVAHVIQVNEPPADGTHEVHTCPGAAVVVPAWCNIRRPNKLDVRTSNNHKPTKPAPTAYNNVSCLLLATCGCAPC